MQPFIFILLALIAGDVAVVPQPRPTHSTSGRAALSTPELAIAGGRTLGPVVPYADWGACPFECCTYGPWMAWKPTTAHARRSSASAVALRIAPGDSVVGDTGVVVTRRIGWAVAVRSGRLEDTGGPIVAGDTAAVLHEEGEGYWKLWIGGRLASEGVNDSSIVGDPEFLFRMVQYPDAVWWARVRTLGGRTGWVREPLESFLHVDRCE